MSKFKVGDWVVVLTRLGFESDDYAPVGHVGRVEFSHVISGDEFWKISGYSETIAARNLFDGNTWFRHAEPHETPSLGVDDLEEGAEYEVAFRGVKKEDVIEVSNKMAFHTRISLPLAYSIRLITPAPVKARPLEPGEAVRIKNWKSMVHMGAIVDHAFPGGVVVLSGGSWLEYQPYSNIERESGEPIEESK